ncbi:MAG TPA: tetratricopeptide repeat protein [Pyrinomonadaceae bacterium]|jgi:Flp pilus assembly protein TadD
MTILVCSITSIILFLATTALSQSSAEAVPDVNKSAVTAIRNGDLVHAVQMLEDAVKQNPKNAKSYYNLGTAYYLLKDLARARSVIAEALTLEPNSAAALNQLGLIQIDEGDYAGAIGSLRAAIEARPDSSTSLYNLGCLYIRTDDFRSSIDLLERAETLDPKNPEVSFNLAFAYGRVGKISRAIEEARATLALRPDDGDARKMIVILYLLNKERTEALIEFQNLERSGRSVDPWLSRLVHGKQIVSVDDLAQR